MNFLNTITRSRADTITGTRWNICKYTIDLKTLNTNRYKWKNFNKFEIKRKTLKSMDKTLKKLLNGIAI